MTDSDEVKLLPCDDEIARLFHEAYERLAPQFSYETRKASAVPWEQVPENNRKLMTAVAGEVRAALTRPPVVTDEVVERLVRNAYEEGVEDGVDWQRSPCGEPQPQWIDSAARVELIRHNRASMPAVVSGGQT